MKVTPDEQIQSAISAGRSTVWIVKHLNVGRQRVNRMRVNASIDIPQNMSTVDYLTRRMMQAEREALEYKSQLAAMRNVIERNQQLLAILDEIAEMAKRK